MTQMDALNLEAENQRLKEALNLIKLFHAGNVTQEDSFSRGFTYGYNTAVEQIIERVVDPLLTPTKEVCNGD